MMDQNSAPNYSRVTSRRIVLPMYTMRKLENILNGYLKVY